MRLESPSLCPSLSGFKALSLLKKTLVDIFLFDNTRRLSFCCPATLSGPRPAIFTRESVNDSRSHPLPRRISLAADHLSCKDDFSRFWTTTPPEGPGLYLINSSIWLVIPPWFRTVLWTNHLAHTSEYHSVCVGTQHLTQAHAKLPVKKRWR
jgi:hypothetical protein